MPWAGDEIVVAEFVPEMPVQLRAAECGFILLSEARDGL